MIRILQFSPTGNAAYIAELLKKAIGSKEEILALEHTDPSTLEKGHHLVIVHAIHAFNAPRTVKRFINQMPPGLYEQVSLIAVGCDVSWVNNAVSKDIRKVLESKNYKIIVDDIIGMPLTFIMPFPEAAIKVQLIEAGRKIEHLSKAILLEQRTLRKVAIKSHVVHFIGGAETVAARFFGLELHANKSCTKCGLCVRECPEKNIRLDEKGKLHFGFKCLMCMRCIYNCPEKSISPRISKFIPISKGYKLERHL
jgi:ferredoxin/flavodoxin